MFQFVDFIQFLSVYRFIIKPVMKIKLDYVFGYEAFSIFKGLHSHLMWLEIGMLEKGKEFWFNINLQRLVVGIY